MCKNIKFKGVDFNAHSRFPKLLVHLQIYCANQTKLQKLATNGRVLYIDKHKTDYLDFSSV